MLPGMAEKTTRYPYKVLATFPEVVGKALADVAELRQTSVRQLLREYAITGLAQDLKRFGRIPASTPLTAPNTETADE
jgi:hypothetical protein